MVGQTETPLLPGMMLYCPTCGREYPEGLTNCPEDDSPLQADTTVIREVPVDPLIGRTFDDKYLLEERLGIGGMGTVYRAKHLLIDRAVALKVLNPRFVEDAAAKARFRREAKAAGRLQHANAVGVTDFGETSDGYVYIVMELLEGKTLRDLLSKEAPIDVARAVSIALQISSAVAAAHEAGIIHRDLKPANIFVAQRSDAPAAIKVLDFGIAKLAADSLDDDDRQTLTLVGAIIGTPRYMSPEQCNGDPLTPAADVYSLGVILYEMLTGTVPFSGSGPIAIALKHSTEAPRSLREYVASINPALEAVVMHALEKKPEDRPADAGAFRQELLETAERLGLEHAASSSAPSIEALRSAGTESPSGRLVIDLGRLRESRAATTSSGELTLLTEAAARKIAEQRATPAPHAQPDAGRKPDLARVEVPLNTSAGTSAGNIRRSRGPIMFLAGLVLALVLGGAYLAFRRGVRPAANANVAATPAPTAEPTPTPARTPKKESSRNANKPAEKPPENKNENKPSKVKKAVNKGKSILRKIF